MDKRVASYARKAEGFAPWSQEVSWYWVLIEGAVGVILGLYFIFSPDAASSTVRYLIAAVLIGASAFDVLNGFRNSRNFQTMMSPMTPYWLVRGGAGLALGIMAVLAEYSNDISDADARKIIGYGLLVWALVGLIGNLDALFTAHAPWMGVLGNALALLIGAALIYNNEEAVSGDKATKYVGYAALIGGLIVLAYAYFVRRGQEEASEISAVSAIVPSGAAAALPETPGSGSNLPTSGTVESGIAQQPTSGPATRQPPAPPELE